MSPTSNDIARELIGVVRLLQQATVELARLDEAAVRAKSAYESQYARAYLTATGTVKDREYRAVIETEQARLEADLAAAQVRACKARIHALDAQLDSARSRGAVVRAEASFAHSGATP